MYAITFVVIKYVLHANLMHQDLINLNPLGKKFKKIAKITFIVMQLLFILFSGSLTQVSGGALEK